MNNDTYSLPDDTKTLQDMVLALQSQVQSLQDEKQQLIEQFRLAQQKRFGASSEGHPGQGELFNEAEAELEQPELEQPEPEEEPTKGPRKQPKRKPLPKDLPREVVVHDIPEEDKVCACCNGELHKVGEDKSEKLEFISAQVKVIEHVCPKLCLQSLRKGRDTEQEKTSTGASQYYPKRICDPQLVKRNYYQ
jgi:hypothetical protein